LFTLQIAGSFSPSYVNFMDCLMCVLFSLPQRKIKV